MRPINQSPTSFLFSMPVLCLLKRPLYSCYTTSTSSPQDNPSTDRYPQSPDKCMHSFHSRRDRGFVSLSKCIECENSLPQSESVRESRWKYVIKEKMSEALCRKDFHWWMTHWHFCNLGENLTEWNRFWHETHLLAGLRKLICVDNSIQTDVISGHVVKWWGMFHNAVFLLCRSIEPLCLLF